MGRNAIPSLVREFIAFAGLLLDQRYLIWTMVKREIAAQYVGSLLGFIWTFIHPLVMITIFWVVFEIGFKAKPDHNIPFVVWLIAGMSIWLAFAEIMNNSSGVVVQNSNLVKKTVFQSQILPIVKILVSMINHAVFMVILLVFICMNDLSFSLYFLQALYYLACMIILALGWSWIVSALSVFVKDVTQIANVVIQIGFWATPIMWNIKLMPEGLQSYIKLNPMWYVVQGYRESFIYFVPFWKHPYQTLYFWFIALAVLISGALIFKRLKPQFADVL